MAEGEVADICSKAASLGAINMNIIPGLDVLYRWPLSAAAAIDKQKGRFVEEVREKTNEAVATWGGVPVGLLESESAQASI
jgi:hypothetical protein